MAFRGQSQNKPPRIGFFRRLAKLLTKLQIRVNRHLKLLFKLLRIMGKAAFAKIQDGDGMVQLYYSRDDLPEGYYNNIKKLIEVGDIVVATGFPFITQTGELTLHCSSFEIVTKTLFPLPEKFHGLQDQELRYRQRYLDMIMNPEVKDTFLLRSKIVSLVRRFFEAKSLMTIF